MAERKKYAETSETNFVNELELRGTVMNIFPNDGFTTIVVASANQLTGRRNYPTAFIFDEYVRESLEKEIQKGDRITLHCSIQTSKNFPKGTIVANSFTKELSRVDAEFSETEYLTDYNIGRISGKLAGTVLRPNDSVTLFTVETLCNDRKAFIRFVKFGSAPSLKDKKAGDEVKVVFGVQSTSTIVDKKRRTTYSLIAQNIQ